MAGLEPKPWPSALRPQWRSLWSKKPLDCLPFLPEDNQLLPDADPYFAEAASEAVGELLQMRFPRFLSHVLYEGSVAQLIQTYLAHCHRPFDAAAGSVAEPPERLEQLSVRALALVLRLFDEGEYGLVGEEGAAPDDVERAYAEVLRKAGAVSAARVLDVVAIYGQSNRDAVGRWLDAVLRVLPEVGAQLSALGAQLSQILGELRSASAAADAPERVADLRSFLLDALMSAALLLDLRPPLARSLLSGDARLLAACCECAASTLPALSKGDASSSGALDRCAAALDRLSRSLLLDGIVAPLLEASRGALETFEADAAAAAAAAAADADGAKALVGRIIAADAAASAAVAECVRAMETSPSSGLLASARGALSQLGGRALAAGSAAAAAAAAPAAAVDGALRESASSVCAIFPDIGIAFAEKLLLSFGSDVDAAVAALMDGRLPPQLEGLDRRSGEPQAPPPAPAAAPPAAAQSGGGDSGASPQKKKKKKKKSKWLRGDMDASKDLEFMRAQRRIVAQMERDAAVEDLVGAMDAAEERKGEGEGRRVGAVEYEDEYDDQWDDVALSRAVQGSMGSTERELQAMKEVNAALRKREEEKSFWEDLKNTNERGQRNPGAFGGDRLPSGRRARARALRERAEREAQQAEDGAAEAKAAGAEATGKKGEAKAKAKAKGGGGGQPPASGLTERQLRRKGKNKAKVGNHHRRDRAASKQRRAMGL